MSEIAKTITLRKPITSHSGEVTKLDLKLPKGATVLRLGEPFTTKLESDGQGGTRIEFRVLPHLATEYLVDMTGINAELLGQLHPLDVRDAFDALKDIMRPSEG